MVPQGVQRKLTAILSAEVKGDGRLMGEDEVGTMQTLTDCREVCFKCVQQHNGRPVRATGDTILAEFIGIADAVRCAVGMQRALAERNAGVSESRCIEYRVGVNLGEVIIEDDEIRGEGVNFAERLREQAEPGGVCISATVRNRVTSTVGRRGITDDHGTRRHLMAAVLQVALLLTYFLGWYALIGWKNIYFALHGSWPCWPAAWICK